MKGKNHLRYEHKNTPLHDLDSRIKILLTLAISLLIITVPSQKIPILATIVIGLEVVGRTNIAKTLFQIKPIILILILTFLLHLFFTQGDPIIQTTILTPTYQGLQEGTMIIVRLALIITLGFIYTKTTQPKKTKNTIQWYLNPLPINEKTIGTAASLSIHLLPQLKEENEKIKQAKKARNFNAKKHPIKHLKTLINPLIYKFYTKTKTISQSLKTKHYNQTPKQTNYGKTQPVLTTILILTLAIIIVI